MRTISTARLPEDLDNLTIIKSREKKQHHRMAAALERTLSYCAEVNAEHQSHSIKIREESEKVGFTTGFTLFFSQLLSMFDEYEKKQTARFSSFRRDIFMKLQTSFHDPVIVERIIHHLQEKSGHQKDMKIIIPRQVPLPEGVELSNYQFTDDNHITVQNDSDAIRFPSESLCLQWTNEARKALEDTEIEMASLIPDTLAQIGAQLIALSQCSQTSQSDMQTCETGEDNDSL